MGGKTAFKKIVEAKCVHTFSDDRMILEVDLVQCHEITTPPAILDAKAEGMDFVFNPNKIKCVIDHVTPAKDSKTADQGKIIRDWCSQHNIEFFDIGENGVCHALFPEKGFIRPGYVTVMGDSHTCTGGAFCAFAAGIGTTDLRGAFSYGCVTMPSQKVIRIDIVGTLAKNVFAKDVILKIIERMKVGSAAGKIVEFHGEIIENMSMEERMTIANMAVEFGATTGMMMVDKTTIDYLWPTIKDDFEDKAEALDLLTEWNSDPDCTYDADIIEIDMSSLTPVTTFGCKPDNIKPISDMNEVEVNQVYIGTCTNGRIEDLRIAAHVLKHIGGKLAQGVRGIVSPATPHIYQMALEEGIIKTFMDAGFCVTNPTCGACLGMSNGVLASGEVCASTSNRNFNGRMGKGGMVHLMSPASAAMTALKGVIAPAPVELFKNRPLPTNLPKSTAVPTKWRDVEFEAPDFKKLLSQKTTQQKEFGGNVFYIGRSDINTDEIIPAKYLVEVKRAALKGHCFEDLDETINNEICKGWIKVVIVKGGNFGCGSSREHAPWALEVEGITCVIASSFARIFKENMFNNGLLCIEMNESAIEFLNQNMPEQIEILPIEGKIRFKAKLLTATRGFELNDTHKEMIKKGGLLNILGKFAAESQ